MAVQKEEIESNRKIVRKIVMYVKMVKMTEILVIVNGQIIEKTLD